MARSINANALAKLATDFGTEPVVIVEVEWNNANTRRSYADKEIPGSGIEGKILSLSGLDEIIQISGGGQSQQITVTIDDTDGEIKAIFDDVDVHKKSVRVYQWFEGLAVNEKFLIFKGQINSIVAWDERERTFEFTIINRIEDVEVGFSAEEGQFPLLDEELIGKPWPLCFGTCINVPGLKVNPAISGTLAGGVGIADFTLARRLSLANAIICPQAPEGFRCNRLGTQTVCSIVYKTDQSCVQSKCVEVEKLTIARSEQKSYEYPVITIFGGNKFPQGKTITLNINGGLFVGRFSGTYANPSEDFVILSRRHPKDDGTGHVIEDLLAAEIKSRCPQGAGGIPDSDFQDSIYGPLATNIRKSRLSWEAYRAEPQAGFFWAGGGSAVTLASDNELIYIANILPSVILRVAAWRTINGNRFLLTVPDEFFSIRQTDYNGYDVMEIVFNRPLSLEQLDSGGGWSNDVFITLTSSVGPNTVDILEWFIDTYTEYAIDSASFDEVRDLVENYPMHFPLLERRNLIRVLQELAEQARCALYQKDDTFFIKYLSSEPSTIKTISEDDIIEGTFRIELTKTEDLATKLTTRWKKDYSLTEDNTLILRHNVKQYGVQEAEERYYAFNILDLVRKSATFWLIRRANTWKRITFSTPLHNLDLEPFDAIEISLPDAASVPVTGIIEKAVYDSEANQLDFTVWLPVLAGSMTPYSFAFPADVNEQALYPTIQERNEGKAGSSTEPNFSVTAPPGHPLDIPTPGLISGFGLACNGSAVTSSVTGECRQDHGDNKPSDQGDQKPEVDTKADQTGDVSSGTSPVTNGAGDGFFSQTQTIKDETAQSSSNASKGQEQGQRGADESGADAPRQPPGDEDGSGSGTQEMLDGLPSPEELGDPNEEGAANPCQGVVSVSWFATKPSSANAQVCVPDGPTIIETYVMNSSSGAAGLSAQFNQLGNCSGKPACTKCVFSVKVPGPDCEPPDGEPPGLIGYSSSSPGTAPIMGDL